MSEIKTVGLIWMALNTFKFNCVTPLHFKGLSNFGDGARTPERGNVWRQLPLLIGNPGR